ncbi:sigma-70 family RNA polymerase sigma factor [Methylotenera versatilis]|uniref:sigma-70 family RNA polymerase sigma factor n=1 Tax=Methylotenera versatilis TaxID=1055487 RepID=UPI000645F4B0|nr:sigma-70 family RNA polymerase sigma factor [Methylotenera versatilis]
MVMQSALVGEFYVEHNSWLHKWLSKKVGSTFDAADLTQDTFMRLLSKVETEQIVEPRAYLTKIAHGLMANFLRRRDIETAYLNALAALGGSQDAYSGQSLENQQILLERIIALDCMLSGLSHNARAAFLLHRVDGMSYAEIALELGVTVSSIKKYIAKALLHCASAA